MALAVGSILLAGCASSPDPAQGQETSFSEDAPATQESPATQGNLVTQGSIGTTQGDGQLNVQAGTQGLDAQSGGQVGTRGAALAGAQDETQPIAPLASRISRSPLPDVIEIEIKPDKVIFAEVPQDASLAIGRPEAHVVREGETLGQIAYLYGLAHSDLALWNSLPDPDNIQKGLVLQLSPLEEREERARQPRIAVLEKIDQPLKTTLQPLQPQGPSPVIEQTRRGAVTRTQIDLGSGNSNDDFAVGAPVALKVNFSRQNHDRLLGLATGGKQAALSVVPSDKVDTVPKNVREVNGISWSWPVNGKLISKFSEGNPGIDIGGPRGQPIYASASGKVIYAGTGLKGFGQLVIIQHVNEFLSTYAHNDQILVAEGQQVSRGELIALMGDSGTDRIALHFGIRRGQESFNPEKYLPRFP